MKTFVPVVIALVVGILMGAWQPRGELLELRARVDELAAKAAKPCKGAGLDPIRSMLRSPDEGAGPVVTRTGEGDAPPTAPEGAVKIQVGDAPPAPDGPRTLSEDDLAKLKSGLDARRAHAMEALREQGELTTEDEAEVQGILDDMNHKLKDEIDRFAAEAAARGEVERRDFMELGANALDVVIATDDALRGALPEDVYSSLDQELQDPLSYVSGDTVASLTKLQGVAGFEP